MIRRLSSPVGAPSQRQLRVGEQLRHVLAEVFARGDLHDPELLSLPLSVLEVRMTPDLKQATVLVLPLGGRVLGGEQAEIRLIEALKRSAPDLRHSVATRLRGLKFVPQLRFRLDDRYDETQRIEKLFQDAHVSQDLHSQDLPALKTATDPHAHED